MRSAQVAAATGGLVTAFGLLVWLFARGLKLSGGLGGPEYVLLTAVGCGLVGFAVAFAGLSRQRWRLERLRGGVLIAGGLGTPLPRPRPGGPADEIDRLQQAVAQLIGRERDRRGLLDRRLESVLGAIDDAIVVVTAQGQVSLLNSAAKELLGGGFGLGASLFELFERESLSYALMLADSGALHRSLLRAMDGREIEAGIAGLGPGGGALLRFAGIHPGGERLLEHDLALHDQAPEAPAPNEETLLSDLPAVSLDTETTGLDVRQDRLLSVAAVKLHGERMFPAVAFDRLVNPGRRIPATSTAIHGITDAMVADATGYLTIAGDLAGFCGDRIWVGHNIGFDIAILRREAKLVGLAWSDPVSLDTLRLYAALRPRARDVELDAVAADLGVDVTGRHTALGDALMTGEVYRRLLPLLAEEGVKTLGDAITFAERPRAIRRLQQALGW